VWYKARPENAVEGRLKQSKFKMLLPVLLLLSATAVSYLLYLNRPPNEMKEAVVRVVQVEAARVQKQALRIPVRAQGTVTAHTETPVVAEVAGRILEVSPSFHAGGYLEKGALIARIDDRDYQAQLLRARAAVAEAESALIQEKGRADVAFREWKNLPNRSQRTEEATSLYLRKPQLAQAEARLLSAQAELRNAEDDLNRTVIRAPYTALVKEKLAELGQYVSPGTGVVRLFAVDYAEVRLAVPQSKLDYLELPGVGGYAGQSVPVVDLYIDNNGVEQHWQAALQRTEGVYDERSRVLFAVARINDPYALLSADVQPIRLGTFVNAVILGREYADIVVLPRHILRAGGYIWVIDEESRLRNRRIETLRNEGEDIFVSAGLEQGDVVCLTNVGGAIDGTLVEVITEVSTFKSPEGSAMEQLGQAPAADVPNKDNSDQSS
jgi:RND family efflux transporter MFP subunit